MIFQKSTPIGLAPTVRSLFSNLSIFVYFLDAFVLFAIVTALYDHLFLLAILFDS